MSPRKCSAQIVQAKPGGLVEHVRCPRIASEIIGGKPYCAEHAQQIIQSKQPNLKRNLR